MNRGITALQISDMQHNGYLSREVPSGIDYVEEINRLRREKKAVILAHYYQRAEIQRLADFLGDSLQLARAAQQTDAEMIVFCGVHFMAETAKILNPTKKVVLPDLKAGCSLADSCTGEALHEYKKQYPNALVASYINCDAGVKAESDVIVTSSNAKHIIDALPAEQEIIFAPDRNLGRYINQLTGRKMHLWDGACVVHEAFSTEKIARQLFDNPGAQLIAHPEAQKPVLELAHFIGSTAAMLSYVVESPCSKFIVATEEGILHEMRRRAPQKQLIPALTLDDACNCSECSFMKLNTLHKLYLCLRYELPEIEIDEDLRLRALRPIERMLTMSQQVK